MVNTLTAEYMTQKDDLLLEKLALLGIKFKNKGIKPIEGLKQTGFCFFKALPMYNQVIQRMTFSLPVYTVDAFSDVAFSGNPAAVCLIPYQVHIDDVLMQKIAAEMNLAETAFVRILSVGDTFQKANRFGLRWFTPTNEVPLCGHATLAAAAVLYQCQDNICDSITFETLSGELSAEREAGYVCLNFPLNKPQEQTANVLDHTKEVWYSQATRKLMVRLDDSLTREKLEKLDVPTNLLREAHDTGEVRGLILTVKGSHGTYDFISRYFSPWNGIPEDHVTARQCSKRGGDLKLQILPDDRVKIAGKSTVVLRGELHVEKKS